MNVRENLAKVREKMSAAARRSGRESSSIRLVAVSKLHPPEAIREAYEAGQRHFGENYVQELGEKQRSLADLADIKWHFIGHLQRNKVKHAIEGTSLIETIDSPRLLEEIEKRASSRGVIVPVLLQVKIGGESTKSGCEPSALPELLAAARRCEAVEPRGLMVIPPFELEARDTRAYFRKLRELRDRVDDSAAVPELSMGMSHDFEVAIEEGSTFVRVGTAIFGARPLR